MSSQKVKGIPASGNTSYSNSAMQVQNNKNEYPSETVLQKIAEELHISADELKKRLKAAQIPSGKGIYWLTQQYNMDMKTFCKLNSINYSEWREYKASNNETFYVISEQPEKSSKTTGSKNSKSTPAAKSEKTSSTATKNKSSQQAVKTDKIRSVEENKQKYGSSFTPAELCKEIFQKSCDYWGAVGRPDFDMLIDEINPKNASAVIKAYTTDNPKNKKSESLINTITSEIRSSKQDRKKAVMKVYDALAEEKGAPPAKREEFKKELDAQFDKFFGMVNTEKLDKIIQEIIAMSKQTPVSENTKITLGNEKTFTAGQLRDDAIKSAKKNPNFSNIQNLSINRPLPYLNSEGKIEASCAVNWPTNEDGSLKGKVVIVNAGHGGYNPSNGYFDSGTVYSTKDEDGNKIPIEEWEIASEYTGELTKKLQAKGATVVVVSGPVEKSAEGMSKTEYLENLIKGERGYEDARELFKNTKQSDIAFISIHIDKCDPKKKACSVTVQESDDCDKKLAENVRKHVGKNIETLQPEIKTNNYYVTRAMGETIPAVLVELGNITNDDVVKSLLSPTDREKYTTALADALEETLLNGTSSPSSAAGVSSKPLFGGGNKTTENQNEIKMVDELSYAQIQINETRSKYIEVVKHPEYTVKEGDKIETIAKKFGVETRSLLAANGLNEDYAKKIRAGQVLIVPDSRKIKNVKNLSDVAESMGVSLDFVKNLKKIEDGAGLKENQFHNKPYKDDAGVTTIGIGHVLKSDEARELTNEQVCELCAKDLLRMEENLCVLLGGRENYNKLPQAMKEALLDMAFNKGTAIIEDTPGLLDCLKQGKYEAAINLFTHNKSTKTGKEMSGLSKRRLLDISLAIKMYNGSVPQSIIDTAQQVYNRGIELLRTECKTSGANFANILAGYNKDVQSYFGETTLKLITE